MHHPSRSPLRWLVALAALLALAGALPAAAEEPPLPPAPAVPVAPDTSGPPAAPQAIDWPHELYLPAIGTPGVASGCRLSAEEAAVAQLLVSDPGQRRVDPVCNAILARVARERAEDMARRAYFDHTNPDGFGPNALVRAAGYPLPGFYGSEPDANNIESIAAGATTAPAVWAMWMGSTSHRTHLLGLDPFWADQYEYGVGYAYLATSPYRHYWVVITARPG